MRIRKTIRATGVRRIGVLAVATALLSAGLITPALIADANAKSFFSAEVVLFNATGCKLDKVTARLDHGQWNIEPPQFIESGHEGVWQSDSNGVGTGTEGEADYFTESCQNADDNQKRVHLHWDVPAVGSNSGDAAGTDGAFPVRVNAGGGDHAGFLFAFGHI